MRAFFAAALAASGAATIAPAAMAQVDSVAVGVMKHNICVNDCKNADKESGVDINGELRFASPGFLNWAFAPRPYLMASANTDGNTSYVGAGLDWDWHFADSWHFEPGFGLVVHDGDIDNPFAAGTQEAVDYSADHVLLGSRALFRTSLALTYDFSEQWGVQAIYEHLSHGQILAKGRNQGLDEVGVRLVWNFQ
jgi:lipid A 3-O-deacylase